MLTNSGKSLAKDKGEKQQQKPLPDGVSLYYTTHGLPSWSEMLTMLIHQKMALVWQLAIVYTENSSFLGFITGN